MHWPLISIRSTQNLGDLLKKGQHLYVVVVVVVITPPLPRDGGTARTPNQVHAINLIEIRLGKRWQSISNQS